MSFSIEIDPATMAEVSRKIQSLVSALEAKDVEDVLLAGARIIRDDAKARAPVKSGRLKKSIKAKKGKRRHKLFATAFASVDFKIAPHAPFVEYGTGPRKLKSGKSVGQMPAKPFFRPAIDARKDEVARVVEEGLARLIGRAARG